MKPYQGLIYLWDIKSFSKNLDFVISAAFFVPLVITSVEFLIKKNCFMENHIKKICLM